MLNWPVRRIVVPVDFSVRAEEAVRTAKQMADESGAEIHLLHVMFPLDAVSPGVIWGGMTDEKRKSEIAKRFAELKEKVGADFTETAVRIGNPGLEIADYAEKIQADLIVIPSHGYHGAKRLMLGSVAERVIRHSRCSVMVLRAS